jgi:hypothetical protein
MPSDAFLRGVRQRNPMTSAKMKLRQMRCTTQAVITFEKEPE